MIKYAIAILIGGGIGALLGAKGSCETGACPLTSNPYIGAVYGAIMGYLLVAVFIGPTMAKQGSFGDSNTSTATTPITTKQQFQEQVLNSEVPVLVDLWATWCGPCRLQTPIVEAVAQKVGDKARVVTVDIDQAGDLAQELNVPSIPTLIVFKNGKESNRFLGTQSADVLERALGV